MDNLLMRFAMLWVSGFLTGYVIARVIWRTKLEQMQSIMLSRLKENLGESHDTETV